MKFQLISDLHLENYKELPKIRDLFTPLAPNLILAGDICFIKHRHFLPFFQKLSPLFRRIIYVLGNHEFYMNNDLRMDTISCMTLKAKAILEPFNNIQILDKEFIELDDDIVVLGCTLWSYISKKDFTCGMQYLPQSNFVRHKTTIVLRPDITNKMYLEQKIWLKDMLDRFEHKKKIVVTHYVPSSKGIDDQFHFFTKAYYSHSDDLVRQANIWCCGHTHEQKIVHIGKTPLYINAAGNPSQKKEGPQNMVFII